MSEINKGRLMDTDNCLVVTTWKVGKENAYMGNESQITDLIGGQENNVVVCCNNFRVQR